MPFLNGGMMNKLKFSFFLVTISFMLLSGAGQISGETTYSTEPEGRSSSKIIGGTESPKNAWPWMAGILHASEPSNYYAQFCGASIIDKKWVITSAHCIKEKNNPEFAPKDLEVLVGAYNLKSNDGTRIKVKRIILHPSYNPETYSYDVALIELETETDIEPVPLYEENDDLVGETAVAIGWGYTIPDDSFSAASTLRQVNLPIVTNSECNAAFIEDITGSMMCAGYLTGGKDTCSGDSGGPLIVNLDSKWVLAGITSWGEGCAKPG
jgi:secreted trypsin-like serine protease